MRIGFSVSPVYFQQLTYMYSSSRRAASPSGVWYSSRFVSVEGVDSHHACDYQEVFEAECLFKLGVEVVGTANHAEVGVEFLAYLFNLAHSLHEALECAAHAHEVPHYVAEALVDFVGALCTLDIH